MRYVACRFKPGDTKGYTYSYDGDAELKPGDRVEVESSGRHSSPRIVEVEVIGYVDKPDFACKPIRRVVLADAPGG